MKKLLNFYHGLHKIFKRFLIFWSILAVIALITAIALSFLSKDKEFNAKVSFNTCNFDEAENINFCFIDIHYQSSIFRLSKNVSSISLAKMDFSSLADDFWIDNRGKITFKSKENLKLESKQNMGNLSYSVSFKPLFKSIKRYFINGILLVSFIYLFIFVCKRSFANLPPQILESNNASWQILESKNLAPQNFARQNLDSKLSQPSLLTLKDKLFLSFTIAICIGLFAFTFWLGFPGYHIIGDTYNSIDLIKDNAHPVFIAYVLQFLYAIFGKHLYYLFLFNLVPFYAGLAILVCGFYLRFKNPIAILLLFPTAIGNFYFQNFIQYHSFSLPMMLFLLYSLVLFLALNPLFRFKKSILVCIFITAFFALLWRHNAIFSVYPIFIILGALYLKNRGLTNKEFTKKYLTFLALSAILCLSIVLILPKILTTRTSYPANHPFLHQIAGACVPANDSSCFKEQWYYPHKSFSDVVALYEKYPLNADPMNVPWGYDKERPFKHKELKGLKIAWIKAIAKHPINFLKHEVRFFKAMWIQEPLRWALDSKTLQDKATHQWHKEVTSKFPLQERNITLSPLKQRIYDTLYENKILLNHIWGVLLSLALMILSLCLMMIKRTLDSLLIFTFASSFAGFFSAFFIAAFSPVPEVRYMSPVLALAVVAFCGFLAFLINAIAKKYLKS